MLSFNAPSMLLILALVAAVSVVEAENTCVDPESFANLQGELASKTGTIESLRQELKTLESEVEATLRTASKTAKALSDAKQDLAQVTGEASHAESCQQDKQSIEEAAKRSAAEKSELTKKNAQLQDSMKTKDTEIQKLKSALKTQKANGSDKGLVTYKQIAGLSSKFYAFMKDGGILIYKVYTDSALKGYVNTASSFAYQQITLARARWSCVDQCVVTGLKHFSTTQVKLVALRKQAVTHLDTFNLGVTQGLLLANFMINPRVEAYLDKAFVKHPAVKEHIPTGFGDKLFAILYVLIVLWFISKVVYRFIYRPIKAVICLPCCVFRCTRGIFRYLFCRSKKSKSVNPRKISTDQQAGNKLQANSQNLKQVQGKNMNNNKIKSK